MLWWSCTQPAPHSPGAQAWSAHLGEGGHGHAVGPLLEGAGRLGREAPGGRAVVGGREGQVLLVQEVACAAALPLLQAAGKGRGSGLHSALRPSLETRHKGGWERR